MPPTIKIYQTRVREGELSNYVTMTTDELAKQENFKFKKEFCQIPKGIVIPPTGAPVAISQIERYSESFVLVPMSAPPQYQLLEPKLGFAMHLDPSAKQAIPKDTPVAHYAGDLIRSRDALGCYVQAISDYPALAINAQGKIV